MNKQKKDKKQRILEAAIALFEKKGAPFVKLNEVAKAAKVPAPLIHYYYETSEDLHYDVVNVVLTELKFYNIKESEKHSDDPIRMLREYLKGPLLWAKERPGSLSIWLYFYYMASFSDRFRKLHTEIRKTGRDRIALMIYRGIEKNVFKSVAFTDVESIAFFIQGQITGELVMYACEERSKPVEHFMERLENSVLRVLGS